MVKKTLVDSKTQDKQHNLECDNREYENPAVTLNKVQILVRDGLTLNKVIVKSSQ